MNRHQRRAGAAKVSPKPAPRSWAEGMRAVHDQAAGAVMVEIITPGIMVEMIGEALAGDADVLQRLSVANEFIREARGSPEHRPMLCGTCPQPIRETPFNMALAIPARDDAENVICIGICQKCGTRPAELLARAQEAFRKIWPDLRAVSIHPTAGRA